MIVYGISTCDTTKKALKALAQAGHDPQFRDVRTDPLTPAEIELIVRELGERVVNKQSTTYRGLSEFLRHSEPEAQIAAHPTVMKRPIIQSPQGWFIGWDDKVVAALIG